MIHNFTLLICILYEFEILRVFLKLFCKLQFYSSTYYKKNFLRGTWNSVSTVHCSFVSYSLVIEFSKGTIILTFRIMTLFAKKLNCLVINKKVCETGVGSKRKQ